MLEKYYFPLKKSYDNVVKENTDLKAYIQKLKQHFQQQQLQFFKEQKNYYQEPPKKYKKVIYQEEVESKPEFEKREQELESEQTETKNKIKKAPSKRKNTNIYDFINKKCREK